MGISQKLVRDRLPTMSVICETRETAAVIRLEVTVCENHEMVETLNIYIAYCNIDAKMLRLKYRLYKNGNAQERR